jgi:DNA-binding SARP family transcriptional activator
LLFGTVKSGAREIPLSRREFALLAYLALHQRSVTLDALVDALWPEADAADGIASVRVYVNRIRKRVAEPDAIASTKRGYGAGPHVVTDIDAIDRAVASADRTKPPEDVGTFLESRRRLARGVPAWVADLPGLVHVQARVNALLDELDELFARWRTNAPGNVCLQFDAVIDEDEPASA